MRPLKRSRATHSILPGLSATVTANTSLQVSSDAAEAAPEEQSLLQWLSQPTAVLVTVSRAQAVLAASFSFRQWHALALHVTAATDETQSY